MNVSKIVRERKKGFHDGLVKQRLSLLGSELGNGTISNRESHFHLHHCAEAMTVRDATRAVSTMLDRSRKVEQGKYRRNSKSGSKTELEARGIDPNSSRSG